MKQLTLITSILLGVCVLGGCSGDNEGGELVDAQSNREEAKKGLSKAESALEDLEENLQGAREEITEKTQQIQKLSKENEELQRQVDNLKADLAEERDARQKAEALLEDQTEDSGP